MTPLSQLALSQLKGAGPKVREKLERLGITDVESLLFHLPFRYEDRTRITPLGALLPEQSAVVEGEVLLADVTFGRRRSLLCKVGDNTGTVSLRFYYFSAAQKNNFSKGRKIRVYGEARPGASGLEFYHPEYELYDDTLPPLKKSLTPVYHTVEGLSQKVLRNLMQQALLALDKHAVSDWLNDAGFSHQSRYSLADALRLIHAPAPTENIQALVSGSHPALQRLILEEMVAYQLGILSRRAKQQKFSATPYSTPASLKNKLLAQLPFQLTAAQQRVIGEIENDLAQNRPMLRLVQGDVGSGKTLVSALAALRVLEAGHQVALMAPTELLAEQHFASFSRWLSPLGISVGFLSGSLGAKQKRETLAQLASGDIQFAVGTHALFQTDVSFARLGLTMVDEQHRFGVGQRLAFRDKGKVNNLLPHQLTLTATPIPRTLAMSYYGDLDNSILDELPPGRQSIDTLVISEARREQVLERIRAACLEGKQAYWVCTLIEESETLQAQTAEATWQLLTETLPGIEVELVHGRLKADEKNRRMQRFANNEAQVLVATTVIEVGVDVPNASLMVIENSERLGLSQLHQLRGRVGRGQVKSFCVLLYAPPLGKTAQRRLEVMRESQDGFYIAEQDWQLRGPGEWFGTRQTGAPLFQIMDLIRDETLLGPSRGIAETLLKQNQALCQALLQRWLKGGEHYADV